FPLLLRIPGWADAAAVTVNGKPVNGAAAGAYCRIDRDWSNGDRVHIRFAMRARAMSWFNESLVIERGPLVYSLKMGENWRKIRQTGPAPDWEVYPTTPWNYALEVEKGDFAKDIVVQEKPVGEQPFSPQGAPVELQVKGRRLPGWQVVDDSAGTLPVSPV